jgi:hypothetical protein
VPQMGGGTPRRYLVGLWIATGGLAFLLCLYHLSATLVDGVFLPADHDSFYHARRIIDSVPAPLRMYQFDARIHAPEGSWVTWPWAYDTLMAVAAGALMKLTGARDPMSVLAFIAPAWVFVNAALFLGVASRLGLSLPARVLAMLFFAVSPLTQGLHRVGMIDHHYVEYSFVLATLYCGLGWFSDPSRRRRAVALGIVLGAAPAFHNGLFALQAPVLAALLWLWALGRPPERGATLAFAVALAGSSALFLLPSEPFRRGDFSYYLHSWFHLYVAACSGTLAVLASRLATSARGAAALAASALVMALPTLAQVLLGGAFVFGKLDYVAAMGEFDNVPRAVAEGRLWGATRTYSALLWLLPLGIGWLLLRLRREANGAALFFVAMTLFGAFLLLQQYRLHYFGSFALILPLCIAFDDLRGAGPRLRAAAAAVLVGAMAPGLLELRQLTPVASDLQYMMTRPIYPALARACAARPGVVLAENADGHYIRFHSECAVISDNFILTPQHVDKVRLTEALLAAPLAEALRQAPYVRYILIRRGDNVLDDAGCGLACPQNRGLRKELLAGAPPAGLRLLMEVRLSDAEPLARLFEVSR